MFERPRSGERAILIHITIQQFHEQPTFVEFEELATSAGAIIVDKILGARSSPDPSCFVGSGKLEEISLRVEMLEAEIVLFNHSLTPSQERNLEKHLKCRVLDRTGLILDIFAQRAHSFEGKLQVELAQLQYLSTRLVRGWTHLERQKGGIGLRGPGETQLETDRRLLGDRIKHINKRLEKVRQQRQLSRKARQKAELPVISLVGYTNAGKSTLFNHLTHASVYAADQLFATLDATLRRIQLPDKTPCILADTVGFIQHLPHTLVAAFQATLEETRQASLLLHIVDASDGHRQERITQVNDVLKEVDALEVPQIIIYNKIDLLKHTPPRLEKDETGKARKIWLSAHTELGIDLLHEALQAHINQEIIRQWIRVPVALGKLRAHLFSLGAVLNEQFAENGDSLLEIQMQPKYFHQLIESEPMVSNYSG